METGTKVMAPAVRTRETVKRVLAPGFLFLAAFFFVGAAFQPFFQAPPAPSADFWGRVRPSAAGPAVAPSGKKQGLTRLDEMLRAERAVSISA